MNDTRPDARRQAPVPAETIEFRPLLLYGGLLCVEGFALSYFVPFITLRLEYSGYSDTAVGFMVGVPALGILAVAFLAPRILARVRAHRAVSLALLVSALSTAALLPIDSYAGWLVLRFARGFACGFVFLVGEYSLNTYIPDRLRGRAIALYAGAFAVSLFVGPFVLSGFDLGGSAPFVFLSALLSAAALAHLALAREIVYRSRAQGRMPLRQFFRLAPMIGAGIIFGAFYETNFMSFMPLYALSRGYEQDIALLLVSVIFIGDALMQYPIGWLADRVCRKKLQMALAALVLALTIPLPVIFSYPALVWPCLFALGACAGGIYTLSLIRMGAAFSGLTLIRALSNSGIIWGVGSLVGPSISGLSSDLLGPNGFIYCLVAVAAGLLLLARFEKLDATDGNQSQASV